MQAARSFFSVFVSECRQNVLLFSAIVCASFQFQQRVGFLEVVSGDSMFPTLSARRRSLVVVERFSVRNNSIRVGDVVTLRNTLEPPGLLLGYVTKRVAGLPGDVVSVPGTREYGPPRKVQVPPGHVYVIGDNLERSRDSRVYGPVPYAMLEGRVFAQLYPHIGWLENRPPRAR